MNEHILQFFDYDHLPNEVQELLKAFYDLANALIDHLPRNPERTVALRKLLEAKDAALRATIARDVGTRDIPKRDSDGHFPGCATNGCEATRCKEVP